METDINFVYEKSNGFYINNSQFMIKNHTESNPFFLYCKRTDKLILINGWETNQFGIARTYYENGKPQYAVYDYWCNSAGKLLYVNGKKSIKKMWYSNGALLSIKFYDEVGYTRITFYKDQVIMLYEMRNPFLMMYVRHDQNGSIIETTTKGWNTVKCEYSYDTNDNAYGYIVPNRYEYVPVVSWNV